jgi:Zn-finger nucleic acid-binding protein
LNLVTIRRTEIHVCTKCVGEALDPGELGALKSMGTARTAKGVETMYGLDALVQLLSLFH